MRARVAAGVVAALVASACSTGPTHVLNGLWEVRVRGASDSTLVLLIQHGTSVVGYDVADALANDGAVSPLCGHVAGSYVWIYFPPDSRQSFSGTFTDAMTVTGTLKTYTGSQSAVLHNTANDPSFGYGLGATLPPPPTSC